MKELVTAVILSFAIVWLVFLVVSIFRKEEIARKTVAGTKVELAALDTRKNDLSKTVSDMDTERGQEASLRETFGVARPGEDVIIVVPKTETAPPPQLTLWQRIKGFFGL